MGKSELSLVLILCLGGCSLASTPARPATLAGPSSSPGAKCLRLLDDGLFSEKVLSCFPSVLPKVEEALCGTPATEAILHSVGFGDVSGRPCEPPCEDPLRRALARLVDPGVVQEWQLSHCRRERLATAWRESMAAVAAGGGRLREMLETLWEPVYASLPATLVGPWRACKEARSPVPLGKDSPTIRCTLWGSYDLRGEDEEIELEVEYVGYGEMFDFATRLKEDLVVEGADCGGRAWKKRKRIPGYNDQILECRRQGRSAVLVVVETTAGRCVRRLPELVELPWTELCEGG